MKKKELSQKELKKMSEEILNDEYQDKWANGELGNSVEHTVAHEKS